MTDKVDAARPDYQPVKFDHDGRQRPDYQPQRFAERPMTEPRTAAGRALAANIMQARRMRLYGRHVVDMDIMRIEAEAGAAALDEARAITEWALREVAAGNLTITDLLTALSMVDVLRGWFDEAAIDALRERA